ncbi:MAG: tetratricopeptide repeat protein [Candidatus Sabulitectum sp.]|nr:tetratricopeptide repeat protein [Candidatus Sabulitectum sp.]
MKKITVLLSTLLMLACSTALAGGSDDATAVGIIPFGYSDDDSRWISGKLSDFLMDNLDSSEDFALISENDLDDAFEDIGFNPDQFQYGVPPEMIIEAGEGMGADLIVFGFVVPGGGDKYQVLWNIVVVSSANTISPAPSMVQKNTDPVRELAETIVSEINSQVGARADESLNIARYHRANSSWDGAITSYLQVLDVDPEHVEAMNELAAVYLKSDVDSVARAEDMYNMVLSIDPSNSSAMSGLGKVALKNENYETAKDYFDQAIEADPDNTAAYSGLASAYTALGMTDEAIASFESALAANPDNLQAMYALGLLYAEMGNYTEAIPHIEAILDVRPDYTNLRLKLASAYSEIGNYGSAADNAIIVLEATPDDTDLALFVAQYEARAGRTSSAVERLNGIIASSGSRQAYLMLATVYRDSGQRSSMQTVFNRLHNAYPGDPVANYMVGAFYYQSGSSKARISELVLSNIATWESAVNELNSAISFLNQVTGYRSNQAQNMVAAARNAISLCEEKIDRVNRYSQ